jgi:GNAT superfamily N-acetyltransferase
MTVLEAGDGVFVHSYRSDRPAGFRIAAAFPDFGPPPPVGTDRRRHAVSGLVIRPYADRDKDAVLALFTRVNRALAPDAMRAAFEDYIALSIREEVGRIPDYYQPQNGASFWVGELDGTLLGMFGIERHDGSAAELRRMYVAPEVRRRGIARAMLAYAEQVCREAGYRRLVLSTSELQPAAIALYRATGYRLAYEAVATTATTKTVGGNLRRYHFVKELEPPA